jgi:hypothetical protein
MRPGGWAALFSTVGWTVVAAPALATYAAVSTPGWIALGIAVGVPIVLSLAALVGELRAPSIDETSADRPLPPAALGTAVCGAVAALLLVGIAPAIVPSGAAVALRSDVGERVAALVPGPSLAWAFVASVVLTALALRSTGGLRAVGILAVAAVVGGAAFVWSGDAAAAGIPRPGECRAELTNAVASHSVATGDVDGTALGTVVGTRHPNVPTWTRVAHDTLWGHGTATLRDVGSGLAYTTGALGVEERAAADDVGADRVGTMAARHCRMVVDGRTALAAFPILRWLTGGDETSRDAGDALVAWRGTLDYWVVAGGSATEPAALRLATIEVSGQPPGWDVAMGLRATLRAASSYDAP